MSGLQRQRSHSDRTLSLLLNLNAVCYIAGMVSGSIAATLSISSTMDTALCGDEPRLVARQLDGINKHYDDVINIAAISAINGGEETLHEVQISDYDTKQFKDSSNSSLAMFDVNGLE